MRRDLTRLATAFSLAIVAVPLAEPQDAIPTVSFEDEAQLAFDAAPDEVCPHFDPRNLGSVSEHWAIAETIYDPANPDAADATGVIMRLDISAYRPGAGPGAAILLIVNRHDPDPWSIYYSILYQQVEVEQITIRCGEDGSGGTRASYRNRVFGFHDRGVEAVSNYVAQDGPMSVVDAWKAWIEDELAG